MPTIRVRCGRCFQVIKSDDSENGIRHGVYCNQKRFQYNDGGRAEAGYRGATGDCVTRAIAIASGLPYKEVYDRLAEGNATQRLCKVEKRRLRYGKSVKSGKRTAAEGIQTSRQWFKNYMAELGFKWTPTMFVGQGCKVHLRADELPKGTIIVSLSRHWCAVVDGVIQDTYDPSRDGTRCVYGYWSK